jgi:phage anti-repressor protein
MTNNKERYIKMTHEEILELKNNGYEEWLEEVEEEFDYIEYEDYINTLINMANERMDDEWR